MTPLILKKQVDSSLEAKHDPSSTSCHPPAIFPSSTDQVEALLDAPAPTTTPSPSPTLYLGASAGLDSASTREQLSTPFHFFPPQDYSFIYERLRRLLIDPRFAFAQFALLQGSLLFNLRRPLILSLFDSSTASQRINIRSTTLDVMLGQTDFCPLLWLIRRQLS